MKTTKFNLREMTWQQRDRLNAKPPTDVDVAWVLSENHFGLKHLIKDNDALCKQVPPNAKRVTMQAKPTCPACLESIAETRPKQKPKVVPMELEEEDDGDTKAG